MTSKSAAFHHSVYVCVTLYLYVHIQPVVEVSQPEEVCEAQRDVEGAQLFVS